MSKGSQRRPMSISQEEWERRWRSVFQNSTQANKQAVLTYEQSEPPPTPPAS